MSGLSKPISIFGINSISPYNVDTGAFYGELRVLESSTLTLTGEMIDLMGGSNKYSWDSQVGGITAEMSLNFSEYPDFVYELFLGTAPTIINTEASGNVSSITNKNGTSTVDATTGIASVGLKSGEEADLKFGKYVVEVTGAATVKVYFSSDYDIARGADESFSSDDLVVESSITIPVSSATVDIGDFGLEFTGGSGSISMTTGDTATFEVRPVNEGGMTVKIGATESSEFPEFGAIVYPQKKSNELLEIDCFRCRAAGMPIGLNRNAYSNSEVTVKVLYDDTENGVFEVRRVKV